MVDFLDDTPISFMDSKPISFASSSPTKFLTLAETTKRKEQEYFQRLIKKQLDHDKVKSNKTPALNPEELTALAKWQQVTKLQNQQNKLDQDFVSTIQKNKDAVVPNTKSLTGQLANDFLAFDTSLAADVVLGVPKAALGAMNALSRRTVSPEAYTRTQKINQAVANKQPLSPEDTAWMNTDDLSGNTYKAANRLLENEQRIKAIGGWQENIKSIVNTTNTDLAASRIEQTNDIAIQQFNREGISNKLEGVATYIGGIADLITEDTAAAVQYTADSLPYMIAMATKAIPSVAVMASNINEEAVQTFQKEYGRMPNDKEQAIAIAASTLSAGFDAVAAKMGIGGKNAATSLIALAKKGNILIPTKILNKLTRDIIVPKVVKVAANVAKEAVSIPIIEGGTEAIQNILEQYAGKQNVSKIDIKPALLEGTIGAASGGLIGGGSGIVRGVSSVSKANSDKQFKKVTDTIDKFKETEAYTPYKSNTIERGTAYEIFVEAKKSPDKVEELKKATHDLIGSLINKPVEGTKEAIKFVLNEIKLIDVDLDIAPEVISVLNEIVTPKVTAKPNSIATKFKEAISPESRIAAGIKSNNPIKIINGVSELDFSKLDNDTKLNYLKEADKAIGSLKTKLEVLPEGKNKRVKQAEIEKYESTLVRLSTSETNRFKDGLNEDIDTLVNTKDPKVKKELVTKVMGSMDQDYSITSEQASKLLNVFSENTKEGKAIREYITAKDAIEVTEQVGKGGGYGLSSKGVTSYQKSFTSALKLENKKSAGEVIDDLKRWYNWHSTKPAYNEVYAEAVIDRNVEESKAMSTVIDSFSKSYKNVFGEDYTSKITTKDYPIGMSKAKLDSRIAKDNKLTPELTPIIDVPKADVVAETIKAKTKQSGAEKVAPTTPKTIKEKDLSKLSKKDIQKLKEAELIPLLKELKKLDPSNPILKTINIALQKTFDSVAFVPAAEKTIRELAKRLSERIGISVKFINEADAHFNGLFNFDELTATINLDYLSLETPVHELLGHPVIRALRTKDICRVRFYPPVSKRVLLSTKKDSNGTQVETTKTEWVVEATTGHTHTFSDKNAANEFYVFARESSKRNSKLYQNLVDELETGEGQRVLNFIVQAYPELDFAGQQEEAIVFLLGRYTANKLSASGHTRLVTLLKQLYREIKFFVLELIRKKDLKITDLPDNLTIADLADIFAYSNEKIVLPEGSSWKDVPPDDPFSLTEDGDGNSFSKLTTEQIQTRITELVRLIKTIDNKYNNYLIEPIVTTPKTEPEAKPKVQVEGVDKNISDIKIFLSNKEKVLTSLLDLRTNELLSGKERSSVEEALALAQSIKKTELRKNDTREDRDKATIAIQDTATNIKRVLKFTERINTKLKTITDKIKAEQDAIAATELRNAILINPIKIKPNLVKEGEVSIDIPNTLSKIVSSSKKETNNIFQKVPDLFSNFKGNLSKYTNITYDKLSEEQQKVLNYTEQFHKKFNDIWNGDNSILRSINTTANKGYPPKVFEKKLLKDVSNYFVQEVNNKRFINSNLIGILSTIGLEWLGTMANSTLYNSPKAVQELLGLPSDLMPDGDIYKSLQRIGIPRALIEVLLGNKAYAMLDLKAKPGYEYLAPKLKLALGQMVITTLLHTDYLEENKISVDKLLGKKVTEATQDFEFREAKFIKAKSYITQVKDKAYSEVHLQDHIKDIDQIPKEAKKILQDILNIESSDNPPSTVPYTDAQVSKFVKNSTREVPTETHKVLSKESKSPWTFVTNAGTAHDLIDPKYQLEIAGEESPEGKHIIRAEAIIAKNAVLKRELDSFNDYKKGLTDPKQSIHFLYEMWRSGRMGIANNIINPLFSKIHRQLISKEAWKVTIDLSDARYANAFKKGIAQALGIKIEDTMQNIDLKLQDMFEDPIIIMGVGAMQELVRNKDITTDTRNELQELIVAAVKVGKQNYHSFQGIAELANAADTIIEGEPIKLSKRKITTDLSVEVDGKTNGIAFSLLQAGIDEDGSVSLHIHDLMNSVGILTGTANNSIKWAKDITNLDIYKRISTIALDLLKTSGIDKSTIDAIKVFLPDFTDSDGIITSEGRSFAKTPVLMFNFGSGDASIKKSIFDGVLTNIYDKLAELNEDETNLIPLQNALRKLTGDPKFTIDPSLALTYEFKDQKLANLRNSIEDTYGQALVDSVNTTFAGIVKYRNALNNTSAVMYHAFIQVYDKKVEETKLKLKRDLSIKEKYAILDDLEGVLPAFKGPRSKDIKDSILALKTVNVKNFGNDTVVQEYAYPVKNTVHGIYDPEQADKLDYAGSKSTTSTISGLEFESFGINALASHVHHSDSVVQQKLMMEFEVLNQHDATVGSILDLTARGFKANDYYLQVSKEYHGLASMHERLTEILNSTLINKQALSTSIRNDKRNLGKFKNISEVYDHISEVLSESDTARKEIFALNPRIDQYVTEGGMFDPSEVKEFTEDEMLKGIDEQIGTIFGSTNEATTGFNNFIESYTEKITPETTQDIFTFLDTVGTKRESIKHQARLQSVLTSIIDKVITPSDDVSLQLEEIGNTTYGEIKGNSIRMRTNTLPPATNVQMSAQETWLHELVHGVTQVVLDENIPIRKQITKLFNMSKKLITPEDFLHYTTDANGNKVLAFIIDEKTERAAAQARYDYIFNNKDGHQLYEFVAFALTNEAVIAKLSTKTVNEMQRKTTTNIFEKIVAVWESILDYITNKFYKIQGQTIDQALITLVGKLNESKDNQVNIIKNTNNNWMDSVEAVATNKIQEYVMQPLTKLYKNKLKDSDSKVLQLVGIPIGLITLIPTDEFYMALRKIRRNIGLTEDNFVAKLVREIFVGPNIHNNKWHILLRKAKHSIDQLRSHTAYITEEYIKNSYLTNYTEEESKALYRVLSKTDLSSIFTEYSDRAKEGSVGYNKDQVIKLLRDPNLLRKEISKIEKQMFHRRNARTATYYSNQSNMLGLYMATGRAVEREVNLNAETIFYKAGVTTDNAGIFSKEELTKQQINTLATLWALHYTTQYNKDLVANKIDAEFNHEKGKTKNGITTTLDIMRSIKEESKKQLFNGKESLMQKGYSSVITDPNVGVIIATIDKKDELKRDGYTLVSNDPLFKDPEDIASSIPMYMYVTNENSLDERVRTITSLTSKKHMGTDLTKILANIGDEAPHATNVFDTKTINDSNQLAVTKQHDKLFGDLSKINRNYFVPIRNEKQGTAGYRYTMIDATKQSILKQDERLEKILAATNASIPDKVNSKFINEEAVRIAYQDFLENYDKEPAAYKSISLKSADGVKYQEIFKLLPSDMRDAIKSIWHNSGDEMLVREELVDLIFGFRKATLLDLKLFNKEIGRGLNEVLVKANDFILQFIPKIQYKGKLPLKALERNIQEVIGLVKDLIVVKSGAVLIGNSVSNTLILMVKGIPPLKAISYQTEAYKAIESYQKLLVERDTIQLQLDSEILSDIKRKNLTTKLKYLNNEIEVNPATKLVDEGIFQSIIEDIDVNDNIYNTGSKLAKFTEEWSEKNLKPWMVTAGKYAWMAKDTPHYQLLFKLTQYGDFVSRYALFKYRVDQTGLKNLNTQSKQYKDQLETIISEVVDTFVNYDIPTSPEMQYLNDMGFLMFSKFTLRIQRIILQLYKERPVSSVMLLALRSLIGIDLSYITDSTLPALLNRATNPFDVAGNLFQVPLIEARTGL